MYSFHFSSSFRDSFIFQSFTFSFVSSVTVLYFLILNVIFFMFSFSFFFHVLFYLCLFSSSEDPLNYVAKYKYNLYFSLSFLSFPCPSQSFTTFPSSSLFPSPIRLPLIPTQTLPSFLPSFPSLPPSLLPIPPSLPPPPASSPPSLSSPNAALIAKWALHQNYAEFCAAPMFQVFK